MGSIEGWTIERWRGKRMKFSWWGESEGEWKVRPACSLVDPASGSMYRDVTMAVVVIAKRYVIVIS